MLVMLSCHKKIEFPALPPTKAVLLFPVKDEACIYGKFISSTQNSMNFMWEKAGYTESYDLIIKNLITKEIKTISVSDNSIDVILNNSTPYAWSVVSKSSKSDVKSESETWKFYNSGPGASNYIPYPAEAITPKMGETITAVNNLISLDWEALDLDNDITSYNLYFDTNPNPGLYRENYSTSSAADITVKSNTTYYWKIVTIDLMGNSSESVVYKFVVR